MNPQRLCPADYKWSCSRFCLCDIMKHLLNKQATKGRAAIFFLAWVQSISTHHELRVCAGGGSVCASQVIRECFQLTDMS